MKIFMLYTTLAAFMLAGCVGGGGSNAAPPDPIDQAEYDIFVVPPANETANIIEQDGNPNNPADDYVFIRRDAQGILFTYRDVDNRDLLGDSASMRTFHIATGAGGSISVFSTSQGGDYLRAAKEDTVSIDNGGAQGSLKITNILEVGGEKLELKYADFGMWKTVSEFTPNGGTVGARTLMHDPENLTDEMRGRGNEAYFTDTNGTKSFSGKAMGVVREIADGKGEDAAGTGREIYGTTSLTLDLGTRNADLDLIFAGFYNFAFDNLALRSNGSFEERDGNGSTMGITDNSNGTGIDMINNIHRKDFDVDGQFYGPDATTPVVATGIAEIEQIRDGGTRVEVDIAFGVKQ